MNRGSALGRALLIVLVTPQSWALALAAFLLRGGILLVALPIVVLPTPVGLGNVLAPTLSTIAFGTVPVELVVVAVALAGAAVAWLVLGGWLAAVLEASGTRMVAAHEDLGEEATARPIADGGVGAAPDAPAGPPVGGVATRILLARLVAALPLGIALAAGSVRLVFVTYRELTSPFDVDTPIALRVLQASPEVVAAVLATWLLGEVVGAVAARRIALHGVGTARAVRSAVVEIVRHPLLTAARFAIPGAALGAVLALSGLATGMAWDATRVVLGGGADPLPVLLSTVALAGLWIVGLVLVGVACAWRGATWTVAARLGTGTFGGSADSRPGDWWDGRSSATL